MRGDSPWVVAVSLSLAAIIATVYFLYFLRWGNRLFRVVQEKTIAHKVEEFLRRSE